MNYYFAVGDQRRGPFPADQLLAQGLRPDMLVWRDGMTDWLRADQLPELASLFPAAATTPPPMNPGYAAAPPYGTPPYGAQPQYGTTPQYYNPQSYNPQTTNSNKIAAGICALLLGGLGIHKFVLGMTGPGLTMLLVTVCTCGWGGLIMGPIAFIEGIIYLTKSDAEFHQHYVIEKRGWF